MKEILEFMFIKNKYKNMLTGDDSWLLPSLFEITKETKNYLQLDMKEFNPKLLENFENELVFFPLLSEIKTVLYVKGKTSPALEIVLKGGMTKVLDNNYNEDVLYRNLFKYITASLLVLVSDPYTTLFKDYFDTIQVNESSYGEEWVFVEFILNKDDDETISCDFVLPTEITESIKDEFHFEEVEIEDEKKGFMQVFFIDNPFIDEIRTYKREK